jgi:hypothetical protein
MLREAAQQKIRVYISCARQEGLTRVQVGEALNLSTFWEERGSWIADLAFDHAAVAEHARLFETLTFPGAARPATDSWNSWTSRWPSGMLTSRNTMSGCNSWLCSYTALSPAAGATTSNLQWRPSISNNTSRYKRTPIAIRIRI